LIAGFTRRFSFLLVAFAATIARIDAVHGSPPKVIKASPDNGDTAVDPSLKELRIEFDQDMDKRTWSFCGEGPQFPEITDKPRWKTSRVIVVPVKLQPDHAYRFSINCPSATNFISAVNVPAEIYPIAFRTDQGSIAKALKTLADREVLSIGANAKSAKSLRRLIDEEYSYRDLRKVDWDKLFKIYTPKLSAAEGTADFTAIARELLGHAKDVHLSLQVGRTPLATYPRRYAPNYKLALFEKIVPVWQKRSDAVNTGRFDDGIGYILIMTWGPAKPTDLEPAYSALGEFADAKGVIVDVRPNSGGDKALAREFAGCFVAQSAVYSKNTSRDKESKSGFGKVYKRSVKPNKSKPAYRGKVAVLMGEGCLSSCESFLLMMRHGAKAKLVGDRSFGSSGNPQPHKLPNGVFVFLPSWKDMQPDGTLIEGKGIEPDLAVKPKKGDFKDADPVLDAALKYLRE